MEKRGLSAVVTAMLMIALTLALVSIVWVVVNNLVLDELENSEGCTNVMGKVEIDRFFTCYDHLENVFQFSIKRGDVELEGVLVSISSLTGGEGFTITEEGVEGLSGEGLLTGYSQDKVTLPGKNSALTYNYSTDVEPDRLEISPIINGNQCSASDTALEFPDCGSLV